ncbi:SIS domain-containing protein [Actinomycetaceae bacterium MB13-C1-2]|nr:SIS domain-containing protein [Actinomycetaceae bacterium MB13-C1-2]
MGYDEYKAVFDVAAQNIPAIREAVRDAVDKKGCDRVLFTGVGGIMMLTLPSVEFMRRQNGFPIHYELGAELLEDMPAYIDDKTLVVTPSVSGTTAETIELMARLGELDVKVLALTGNADSPIAKAATYNVTTPMADPTSSEVVFLQTLVVALELLGKDSGLDVERTFAELQKVPNVLISVKEQCEPTARKLAEHLADHDYHILTSAGNTWFEVDYYAMCILEEMQWIRTRAVHSSDFFHGTLELVEKGVSVLILNGLGPMRALSERVARFAPRVTDSSVVVDLEDFRLDGLSDKTQELIAPAILATVFERTSKQLEDIRNHPLTTRRYYKKMDY